MSQSNKYPIVLRFQGLFPNQLGRFQMHANRAGGDMSHIDETRTDLNEVVMGSQTWVEDLRAEIAQAAAFNLHNAITARKAKHRAKEANKLEEQGSQDPWKFTRSGPLREGILTVNAEWFGGAGGRAWDPDRVRAFKTMGLGFLAAHFSNCCVHARIDHDEDAMHFHFVLAQWNVKYSENRGEQKLLQPSSHPLLADYELAQDAAGEFFEELGLVRGQTRAAERRVARKWGAPPSAPVRHIPPQVWRADEAQAAMNEAARQTLEMERLQARDLELSLREAEYEQLTVRKNAIEFGIAALSTGDLVFRQGAEGGMDKIVYGPQVAAARREELKASAQSVYAQLLKYAQTLQLNIDRAQAQLRAGLDHERRQLERERKDIEERIATIREDANAIAAEIHRMHLPTSGRLREILRRYPLPPSGQGA